MAMISTGLKSLLLRLLGLDRRGRNPDPGSGARIAIRVMGVITFAALMFCLVYYTAWRMDPTLAAGLVIVNVITAVWCGYMLKS